jgi:hypothetical protein
MGKLTMMDRLVSGMVMQPERRDRTHERAIPSVARATLGV